MSLAARQMHALACNNAWSNLRLLDACSRLTDEEFAATRVSFFPSIRSTLSHILTVDWYYLEILERSRAGLAPHPDPARHYRPEEPFARCDELARAQRQADARLVAYCEALDDAALAAPVVLPRRAGTVTDRAARILLHLIQHAIHHRGQVHAMLAGTGVRPPQLDEFFCQNEEALRSAEFARLGFSEDRIWGDWAQAPPLPGSSASG